MAECACIERERISYFLCSRPVFYSVVITAFVLAVLGALSLAGLFYPSSPLQAIGSAFGNVGSCATLGVGLAILLTALFSRLWHQHNHQPLEKSPSK